MESLQKLSDVPVVTTATRIAKVIFTDFYIQNHGSILFQLQFFFPEDVANLSSSEAAEIEAGIKPFSKEFQ